MNIGHLRSTLCSRLGRQQAARELQWMNHALRRGPPAPACLPSMIERRLAGEPLQYILGTQPFGPLDLLTRPPVLIPRPETEHWTIQLAHRLSPTPQSPVALLDLCTGSGCIPLLLSHLWPPGSVRAYGVDISPDAVELAQDNADRVPIPTQSTQNTDKNTPQNTPPQNVFTPFITDIRHSSAESLLADIGPFDVVTANPPYIPKWQYDTLPCSVKDFEDPRALLADHDDDDGLSFYRTIARLLSHPRLLAKHATVALEVGHGQAHPVKHILETDPRLLRTEFWLDPWAKQRVVVAVYN